MKVLSKRDLYVDCDGVILNTITTITSLYNEDFQYYKKFKPIHWTDIETWDFQECNCATPEYINTYFNQPRFFERAVWMPWCKEKLSELKSHYNIKIVSMGYSPNLVGKEQFFKEHLPFCEFIGVNMKQYKDKSHIDMGENAVFIDDSANNLIKSNARMKLCFGDVYDWNKNWDGIRCFNWNEVAGILLKGEGENK